MKQRTKWSRRALGIGRYAKHKRLKALPYFEDIDRMVNEGCSCYKIARWIREKKGDCHDITLKGLVKAIEYYRVDIPPVQKLKVWRPELANEIEDRVKSTLDEIVELNKLYFMLESIITETIKAEEDNSIEFPLKGLGEAMLCAGQILDQSACLKIKIGLLPKNINNADNQYSWMSLKNEVEKNMLVEALENPRTRRKVIEAVGEILMEEEASQLSDLKLVGGQ